MKHSEEALRFIRQHIAMKGYPPSRAELGRWLGLASKSSAQNVIDSLEREGLIEVDRHIDRGIRIKGANMKARTEEL